MTDVHIDCRAEVHAVVAAMAPSPTADLGEDTRLAADLAYDSVRLIELSIALEQHFQLTPLDESQVATVATVGDVVDMVASVLGDVR